MSSAFQSNAFQNNAFQITIEFFVGGRRRKVEWIEPKKVSLDSSDIDELIYDENSHELSIKFKTDAIYNYNNIDEKKVKGLIKAKSPGKYFHKNIKGKHFTTKIK